MFDRERLARIADGLAVALAVSLPWSTSATGILAALWLIALIPTLDVAALRRVLSTPAGGLPVLLWVLALVGMLWAFDVPMAERLDGLSSFHKLLFIPLLIAQFHRSERGPWVMNGFLVSCVVLLVLSWTLILCRACLGRGTAWSEPAYQSKTTSRRAPSSRFASSCWLDCAEGVAGAAALVRDRAIAAGLGFPGQHFLRRRSAARLWL